ncbi:ribosome biogenesis protein SLX9-domain-containing protein [Lactarius akahatsu]|uniref:Ribosome biogenesis protein SLX9 n=1 Tax=Lactarius akahatsu TaxID=416441 RepID=A0AAD4LDX2_9AGAM|nr:ribosome biogenesis protein SLX9-domain-containing protein [Lactarius akahatsu]
MPKVRSPRSISRAHTASAKPVSRAFAVQDNSVQHVTVGAFKDVPADEILHSVNNDDGDSIRPATILNKKEKRILKHELFIERLEASRAPYSKSHARRLKRKERERLAGGGMESLASALPSITTDVVIATGTSKSAGEGPNTSAGSARPTAAASTAEPDPMFVPDPEAPSPPARLGQIGQGKGTPLTRSQRRRALKAERFRQPLIRADPAFATNPFGTIRTHAQNTLVAHPTTT